MRTKNPEIELLKKAGKWFAELSTYEHLYLTDSMTNRGINLGIKINNYLEKELLKQEQKNEPA